MKTKMDEFFWLNNGVVRLIGEINDVTADLAVQQLLFLKAEGFSKVILLINSPGGSVVSGFAVYDTMQSLKAFGITVCTVCYGFCASMAAFLLAAGNERICLPNAEVMIHQPLGGMQGQAADLKIQWEHMHRVKERYDALLSKHCGKTTEEIAAATDRDNFMSPEEAMRFGLIDRIANIADILEEV